MSNPSHAKCSVKASYVNFRENPNIHFVGGRPIKGVSGYDQVSWLTAPVQLAHGQQQARADPSTFPRGSELT